MSVPGRVGVRPGDTETHSGMGLTAISLSFEFWFSSPNCLHKGLSEASNGCSTHVLKFIMAGNGTDRAQYAYDVRPKTRAPNLLLLSFNGNINFICLVPATFFLNRFLGSL